jgi:xylan 1,4-beta-xylosidase
MNSRDTIEPPKPRMRQQSMKTAVCCALLGLSNITGSSQPASTFQNPILPGFYPDPSICRVGQDYYLVNSSFEFFPGVPIFRSQDLVHWRQIGHCLTRTNQLSLHRMRASGGIYAPTLRHHKGTFYMVTTLVNGGGNFYVTAKNPAGPWSDPVWLDRSGIDPSLFFDDDGTVYYTRHQGQGDGSIAQAKLNLKTGKLEGELKEIWKGTGGVWPEGPHLYKVKGKYFLMIAEGGTSYDHMVTVARSDSPWGPFVSCPHNPILTHRHRPDHPLQALGHADLVQTPDGWWMVLLGIRPQGGKFHHLGRETLLAPVTWTTDNWPAVNGNGTLELTLPAPRLTRPNRPGGPEKQAQAYYPSPRPAHSVQNTEPPKDEFDKSQLAFHWNFLRNPYEKDSSLSERPGWLRLHGSAITLNDQDSPAFVGRRQTFLSGRAAVRLSFEPQNANEEAGLVLRGNEKNHYEIGLTLREGKRVLLCRKTLAGKVVEPVQYEQIGPGDVILSVQAAPTAYEFFCQPADGGSQKSLGTAFTRDLSSEKVGGFTGVYIGMYATGNGQKNSQPADFDWFEYRTSK